MTNITELKIIRVSGEVFRIHLVTDKGVLSLSDMDATNPLCWQWNWVNIDDALSKLGATK